MNENLFFIFAVAFIVELATVIGFGICKINSLGRGSDE